MIARLERAGGLIAIVGLGLALNFLPVLLFQYFPTQDGPAHLNTAAAVSRLNSSEGAFFSQVFEATAAHSTNFLATKTMSALLSIGLTDVDKITWLVLMSCMVLVIGINLGAISRSSLVLAPLGFLLTGGVITHLGFMNYFVGLIVFVQTLFLFNRGLQYPNTAWLITTLLLAIITYLAHPLAGLALGAVLGPFAVAQLTLARWRRRMGGGTSTLWGGEFPLAIPVAAFLVCIVLLAFAANDGAAQIGRLFEQSIAGAHPAMSLPASQTEISLARRVLRAATLTNLVSYSVYDRLFSLTFLLTFGALLWRRLATLKMHPVNAADGWLVSAATLFGLAVAIPVKFELFLFLRLTTCMAFVLLLWAAAQHFSQRQMRTVFFVGLLASLGSLAWQLEWTSRLNRVLDEYASIATIIPERSTVLSIHNADRNPDGCKALALPKLPCAFKPTLHFLGQVVAGRNVALLTNYQLRPGTGFFPLTLRRPWSGYTPYIEEFLQWDLPKNSRARSAKLAPVLQLLACQSPDLIVTWNDRRAEGQNDVTFDANIAPLLSGYRRIFTSRPSGAANVYAREGGEARKGELPECRP